MVGLLTHRTEQITHPGCKSVPRSAALPPGLPERRSAIGPEINFVFPIHEKITKSDKLFLDPKL
jgi:hypothetical protein